jgi:hypothetical protein
LKLRIANGADVRRVKRRGMYHRVDALQRLFDDGDIGDASNYAGRG